MRKYTVIGFNEESLATFSHPVTAENSMHAFFVAAQDLPGSNFVAVLDGHIQEYKGIMFPGESVVSADTILDQDDVFGPDGGDDEHGHTKAATEVIMSQLTTGLYMVRIEDDHGAKEIQLAPEEFAKAVTGKLARGS